MRNQVILSYSYKDIHRARRLRDALRFFGLGVWPADILTPGIPSWKAALSGQLESAVCVVVILSKDTHMSNWVTLVLDYARAHGLPVLPVVMDGEPGHTLLVELDGDDWFDLRWSRNFLSECTQLVGLIRSYSAHDAEMVAQEM